MPVARVKAYPNNRPWVTRQLRFTTGNREGYRAALPDARKMAVDCKEQYKTIESNSMLGTVIPSQVWLASISSLATRRNNWSLPRETCMVGRGGHNATSKSRLRNRSRVLELRSRVLQSTNGRTLWKSRGPLLTLTTCHLHDFTQFEVVSSNQPIALLLMYERSRDVNAIRGPISGTPNPAGNFWGVFPLLHKSAASVKDIHCRHVR